MPIKIYGESWYMHFQVDINMVLYMVDTEPVDYMDGILLR